MVSFDGKSLTSQNHRMSVSLQETSDKVYLRNSVSMSNTHNEDFFSNTECPTLNHVGRTLSPVTGACRTGAFDGAVAAINDVQLWYLCICKSHHLNIVHSE